MMQLFVFYLLPVVIVLMGGDPTSGSSLSTCPTPSNPPNSHFFTRWNGLVIQYECDHGFVLFGAAVATCRNGRWNRPAPTCLPRAQSSIKYAGGQKKNPHQISVVRSLSDLQYQLEYNLPTTARHLVASRLGTNSNSPLFSWDSPVSRTDAKDYRTTQAPFSVRKFDRDAVVMDVGGRQSAESTDDRSMRASAVRTYSIPETRSSSMTGNPHRKRPKPIKTVELPSSTFASPSAVDSNNVVDRTRMTSREPSTALPNTISDQAERNDDSDINGTESKPVDGMINVTDTDEDHRPSSKNNFLSVEYVDVDLATLDSSCVESAEAADSSNVSDPVMSEPRAIVSTPNVSNAAVDVYRRRRNPEEPYNVYVEAFYVCSDGFQMRMPLTHSLYCSDRKWTGIMPECVPLDVSQIAPDAGIEDDDPQLGNVTLKPEVLNVTRVNCDVENGGCEHSCRKDGHTADDIVFGSGVCICFEGFELADDGKSCRDVDECATNDDICDRQCWNIPGSYLCYCPDGYALGSDRKSCLDKNECLSRNGHGPCQDVCTNSDGTYECSCTISGTQLSSDNHTCEDIDECSANNFGCSHTCLNTIGTAFCTCPDGFMLGEDWKTCGDVDECQFPEMVRNCHDHRCVNTVGSYKCESMMSPMNSDAEESVLSPPEDVNDKHPTLVINCTSGYSKDDRGKCAAVHVDACSLNNFGCSHNCGVNSLGSATCSCPPGFILLEDWKTCEDVNECDDRNFGCSDACINTLGSAHCLCPSGFTLIADGKTCEEVDECDGVVCSHECDVNTARCICPAGFKLNSNGFQCDDVDECLPPTGSCEQICVNTPGSFHCACYESHELSSDGRSCSEVTKLCPPLTAPANGHLKPDSCYKNSKEPGEYCYFICDGVGSHKLIGSSLRVCNRSGQWEPLELTPRCEQIHVTRREVRPEIEPFIVCPPTITAYLHLGHSKAPVRISRPKTNIDFNAIRISPAWIQNMEGEFPAGKTFVDFRLQNHSTACSVLVIVLDKEPPSIVSCPAPIRLSIGEERRTAAVNWIEPRFADNVGVDYVWKSKTPGIYALGLHKVEYVARDAAGNSVRCVFTIEITTKPSKTVHISNPESHAALIVTRSDDPRPTTPCSNTDADCALLTSEQMDLLRTLYWAFTKGCLSDRLPLLKSLADQGRRSMPLVPLYTKVTQKLQATEEPNWMFKKYHSKADHRTKYYANNVLKPPIKQTL